MLTSRQQAALSFITDYIAAHNGTSPSYDEIVAELGVSSRSNASRLVAALEQRGFIERIPFARRSIRIKGQSIQGPPSHPLIQAVEHLLQSIVAENPEKGYVIVDADALGDLDIALSEMRRPS